MRRFDHMIITTEPLTLEDCKAILLHHQQVEIADEVLKNVNANYNFLQTYSKDKVIYGINTGFGPMAQYKISDEDRIKLQYNLIRSHCSGSGNPLPPLYVRAAMLARLQTLLLAKSGVHESVVLLLKDLINLHVTPVIYEHGGVGASGDLVQLAHLALCLIGEGKAIYQGKEQETATVFKQLGLSPIQIHLREGLAIMNGTSVMTGIGLLNLMHAENLLDLSVTSSALINELIASYNDYFSEGLNSVKRHSGQNYIAAEIRKKLEGSQLIRKREDHLYKKTEEIVFTDKVQEYYSIRCVPQILGPIHDTITSAKTILENELNSVNDNPVINHEEQHVYHGGNFHGDYVSLEMDKLKIAITKLSMLAERQLNYLMNSHLNGKFPPFMNRGALGLNFGIQGVQFTATSTVAENQTLSFPMYVHSIPNNNDNQDMVSMGTNSALLCKKVIDNTLEVLAIQMMAISQAVAILEINGKLSASNQHFYDLLSDVFTPFIEDNVRYEEIRRIKNFLLNFKNLI